MSLASAIYDSLPYIDNEPSAKERAAALALVADELSSQPSHEHPSLPPLPSQIFTPLIQSELERIDAKRPLVAVDRSRYEALEPPVTSPTSDEKDPTSMTKWKRALEQAYTSHNYLVGRQENLTNLETYGKNSWLISNSQLEDILQQLERELAERKTQIDMVVIERKNAQEAVEGEVTGLDSTWKRGVGRALEVEVAAEILRRNILLRRREGAQ